MLGGNEIPGRPFGLVDTVRQALRRSGPSGRFGRASWDRLAHELTVQRGVPVNFARSVADFPIGRLFATELGAKAAHITRNEGRALQIIGTLGVEVLEAAASAELSSFQQGPFNLKGKRMLFMPGKGTLPPALLVLDPEMEAGRSSVITRQLPPIWEMLPDAVEWGDSESGESAEVRSLFLRDRSGLATALAIAQPEVILMREPRMELMSVPSPLLKVTNDAEQKTSTAGLYCRDAQGTLGVTGCYHDTGGPIGTTVTVNGIVSHVTLADPHQDIVFIPLPPGTIPSTLTGIAGVMSGQSPAPHSPARFEGATSGETDTHIIAQDFALLKNRPGVQQRLQTDADANKGDSGCALITASGWVVGFAYRTSAADDYPQFSDWIWASNALNSLGLQPI